MKKLLSITVVLLLSITLITGCANSNNQTQPSHSSGQSSVDTSEFIGEEKAKEIALEEAGLTAEQVVFDRVELDEDDGFWHYEVEFRQDRTEYDADINATDGSILDWDVDRD